MRNFSDSRVARDRVSLALAVLGGALIGGLGLAVYLADGSYFLGEASVVLSLDGLSIRETFTENLLAGGQNFPRIYLLAIRLVRMLGSEQTWATRLLPQLFFLAGTVLWMRLLWLRFRARPSVLLLGVVLLASVATWPIYGAAVKQYSLDVFFVLLLFSVPDRVLDEGLRGGRGRARLLALALPTALSYTYGVALLARVLGWYAYGARRHGVRIDIGAAALLGTSFAALSGLLWFTDLRHTLGQEGLFVFWESCILPAPPSESAALLDRFLFGWYERHVEFMQIVPLPVAARVALYLTFALGVVGVALQIFRPREDAEWGSRSVGCLAGVTGAIATSFVVDYPICSGRLLLYALFFQQMLLLEGVDRAIRGAARVGGASRFWRASTGITVACLTLVMITTAFGTARDLMQRVPIEDVRPQLAVLQTAPELPVIVTSCMEYQIRTLPEGLGMSDVTLQPFEGGYDPMPFGAEVWIIHSVLFRGLCRLLQRQLGAITSDETPRAEDVRGAEVLVYRTHILTQEQARLKKERHEQDAGRRIRERRRAGRHGDDRDAE